MDKKILSHASVKPTAEILALFEKAKELDADGLGNAEIFERAGKYLVENESVIDFKNCCSGKKYFGEYKKAIPASFKVRVNDQDLYLEMLDVLKKEYNLSRVKTTFLMKVALCTYCQHLENFLDDDTLEESKKNASTDDALKLKAISLLLITTNKRKIEDIINRLEE